MKREIELELNLELQINTNSNHYLEMRTLNCIFHRVLGSAILFAGVIATLVWLSGDCRLTPALHEKNIQLNRTVTDTKVNPGECLVFNNLSLFQKKILISKVLPQRCSN